MLDVMLQYSAAGVRENTVLHVGCWQNFKGIKAHLSLQVTTAAESF